MNKNNFAPLPPMGWNSYDYYDTTVTEDAVKANADYMAAHLKEFGWEYIVVDIEWYAIGAGSMRDQFQYIPFADVAMDEFSRLQPDPARFPSSADGTGFTHLADYIHSLGLKFGIHIMRGIPRTAAHNHCKIKGSNVTADMVANPSSICGWNPDMYGVRDTEAGQAYYDSLMELYTSWGVDFIKCDDICNTNIYPANPYSARHEIEMLAKAIARPDFMIKAFLLCPMKNTTECILYPLLYFCLCVTTLLKDIPVNSCLKCTCHLFFPLHKILFFYHYHICFFIQILPNPSLLFPIYCEKCPAFRRSIFTRLF